MKRIVLLGCSFTALVSSATAFAGGFEYPGNGTEAMARGGAFTAKADDASAFDYNIAGFARQRGTRLMFDSNLIFNSETFKRLGGYPTSSSMAQPYDGTQFPQVRNSAGPGYVPMVGLSTDFGYFDRWTFAIGLFAPNSVSSRVYPTTVTLPGGVSAPAPQRYDVTKTDLLIAFPTLAVAFRPAHWIDVGVALQLAYANLDLANDSLVYVNANLCKNLEDTRCDGFTEIKTTAITATGALGLMFHPTRSFDIGINVRPQININSKGKAYATAPPALANVPITPGDATFKTALPTVLRLGLRYAFKGPDRFEHGDIEVDADYENWKNVEGDGDKVAIPDLDPLKDLNPTITHHYQDTASVRVGGSYNLRLPAGVLSFRAGFFDSAATKDKDTRVDFDTMAKYSPTVGLGYMVRGVGINVAYAYIWEPDRNVSNGDIQSINGINHGLPTAGGMPTPVINNGFYHASNQMLSIGLTIAWDDLLRKRRVIHWQ